MLYMELENTDTYDGDSNLFNTTTNSVVVEDEIELTAFEVYKQLEKAWLNEKFSPELLIHRSDIIDCVLEEVKKIEDEIINNSEKNSLDGSLKKMEVQRIRYMVANYLRLRIEKIEHFIFDVIETDEKRKTDRLEAKLSPEEMRYAIQYRKSLQENFQSTALQHMPPNLQALQPKQIATLPALDQFVFVRAAKLVKDVVIQDPVDETREEILDLEDGSQHLLPYKAVAGHVKNGDVSLI